MPQPRIISQLEQELGIEIKASKAESLQDFMRYGRREEDKAEYLLKEEMLIGLKLRTLGLGKASFLKSDELANLQALYLVENDFSKLTLPESLHQLRYLNLADNKELASLDFAGKMPFLQELDLSDSGLQSLHLSECPTLKKLDVSRNQLTAFSFSSVCPELWWLDLSGNEGLKKIALDDGFGQLQYFYLYKSGLEELKIEGSLPRLKVLDLEGNQLKQWPVGFLLPDSLETLYLEGNPIENIPETTRGSGDRHNSAEDVRQYLLSIRDKRKVEYLHQAKMILVGNGEVGKSSIRIKLKNPDAPLPEEDDRTPGLDIEPYTLQDLPAELTGLAEPIDFQLNIWDFGGQSRYREVQQLFCSPQSLYLFVTSCDDQPNLKEDYVNFDYWMSMVHALSFDREAGKSSPVIHVVNKIDKGRLDIDQRAHNRFGNVAEFLNISCEKLTNFDTLRKAIRRVLPEVGRGIFRDQYNEDWIWVMEELQRRRNENHITYQQYLDEVCKDKLNDREAASWIRTLDRIGAVIFFGEHEKLKDWIILNPNWVKQAVFEVIDSGEINPVPEWRFEKQVWKDYTEGEQKMLFLLMQAYDLCYAQKDLHGRTEYVVPALLESHTPDFESLLPKDVELVNIRLEHHPFLPAGTVSKLMVRLNRNIFRDLMWKNNVILHHPDTAAYVHVQEDWTKHKINLKLYGREPGILYQLVTNTLQNIHEDFKNTKFIKELEFSVWGYDGEDWLSEKILKKTKAEDFSFLWHRSFPHFDENQTELMNKVHEYIAKGRVEDALEVLEELAPGHLRSDLLQLKNRFSKLQRDSRMGVLSSADERLEHNKIVAAILELAKEAEDGGWQKEQDGDSPAHGEQLEKKAGKKKILFICSSPDGKNPLDFGKEFKSIGRARQLADSRDDYEEPRIQTGVEADEFLHILTKYQPDILHISLHSSKSKGLYFEDKVGKVEPVSEEDFKDIMETYASDPDGKGRVETIVLSCCNSGAYGKAIANLADNIIATRDFFPDPAAVVYANEFYRMLFNNKDIAFAHRTATIGIKRKKYSAEGYNHPIHEIPILIKNETK